MHSSATSRCVEKKNSPLHILLLLCDYCEHCSISTRFSWEVEVSFFFCCTKNKSYSSFFFCCDTFTNNSTLIEKFNQLPFVIEQLKNSLEVHHPCYQSQPGHSHKPQLTFKLSNKNNKTFKKLFQSCKLQPKKTLCSGTDLKS